MWDKPLFYRLSATDWAEGDEKDAETGEWRYWGLEQSIVLVGELKVGRGALSRGKAEERTGGVLTISTRLRCQKLGVDLIDTSSGGNWAKQKIPVRPGYQGEPLSAYYHLHFAANPTVLPRVPVPFAAAIKKAHPDLPIGAVGLLTTLPQIEEVLSSGKADVAFVARQIMRDADFVLEGAEEMGVIVKAPVQNERGELLSYFG